MLAYVEAHIEQGPVLEAENLGVGVVTGINGASRFIVRVGGTANHAGTVPMKLRRDALAGRRKWCWRWSAGGLEGTDLVATVGKIEALPGAVNVIPGGAVFTIDLRSPDDAARHAASAAITGRPGSHRRTARAVGCRRADPRCSRDPVRAGPDRTTGRRCPPLRSGASDVAERCRARRDGGGGAVPRRHAVHPLPGGVSHNPAESITVEDADLSVRVLLDFIRHFDPAALTD